MEKVKSSISIGLFSLLVLISCGKEEPEMADNGTPSPVEKNPLTLRSGPRPETTTGIPHVQIGVELVPEVHEEMIRRIYSIPGIEDQASVVLGWRGMWLSENINVVEPGALLGEREFGHIHDDGSLHLFLEPRRATQAVDAGWAIFHPFAVQNLQGWDGFVMLYTPQSFDELDVTFQLIVDGFNFVSGQMIVATDYYE